LPDTADGGARRNHEVQLLLLLAASGLLLIGLWMRWPSVGYVGPATQDAYNSFAFDRFAYSDIASLYFRDGLAGHPRPYLDYPFEYPVGMGLLIYLLNAASPALPQYFLLTSLWMTLSALVIALIVPRFPHGRLLLFACSPALALYVNLNWDMWGVLLMVVALYLFTRERDGWAATVLAAAVWTKFFPIVFLPFLVADRWRRWGWRAAGRLAAVFVIASAAINAPLLVVAPGAWWYFFQFNAERGREWNLWIFFDRFTLSAQQINLLSAALLAAGLVALLIMQWRAPPGAWLLACCAAMGWFFFVGKVYSPQYGLWIVALLAVIGASAALAVAWSAVDLLYFGAGFVFLGLSQYGEAQQWFAQHGFVPATALREGVLLVVVGWCIWQMRALTPKP
jgi:hypothetical protein